MSVVRVVPPFEVFPDIDGDPLDSGSIYIGMVGLNPEIPTNQIPLFWDANLTIPALQPIRTLGGFPIRNGAASNFYVNSQTYSISVRNKNGSLVYSDLYVGLGEVNFNTILLCKTVVDMTASSIVLVDGKIITSEQASSVANTGTIIETVWNNTTSKAGGARYEIKTLAQHRTDIGDPAWVPDGYGDHYLFSGTTYVGVLSFSGSILASWFGILANNTDCVSTINRAMQYAKSKVKGSQPIKVVVPYVGTINVTSTSLLFPRNIVVDLSWNRFYLTNGANKYLFSQDDFATDEFIGSAGGTLEVFNFTIDGNASNQTRSLVGTDARDMYCGFGAMFFGIKFLKVHDFICINTNSWGFAYFKCRDTEWYNGVFDQDKTRIGLNGDGITGIAARTHIWNMTGYTNDDFCAMGTTRASIGGVQIWNDGVDIECFNVHDIELTEKGGKWPHFACGVYPSDGNIVKQWTMKNISGNCENGLWRCANYFSALGATNGVIENIVEDNIAGYSKTVGYGQRHIERISIYSIYISNSRNVVADLTDNNQFIRLVTSATVNSIAVSNTIYQQLHTPSTRKGVIYIDNTSSVLSILISNFFHSLTLAQTSTPERFTLIENLGTTAPTLTLSGVSKSSPGAANLNSTKADFWVSTLGVIASGLNIRFSEGLTLNSANYSVDRTPTAIFNNGYVSIEGAIISGGTVAAPAENDVLTRPTWAKPKSSDKVSTLIFVGSGGSAAPQAGFMVVRNADTTIDFTNISGSPTSSYISFDGFRYEVDPNLP